MTTSTTTPSAQQTAQQKKSPTQKSPTQKHGKPPANQVSLYFVANDPSEQQAINVRAFSGDLVRSPFGTQQVQVKITGYDLITDENGVVLQVVLTGAASATGTPMTLTYSARRKDLEEIDRLVEIANSGTRKLNSGWAYLQESTYESNKGTWCGKVTLYFSKYARPVPPTPVVQVVSNPVSEPAPIQPVPARTPAQKPDAEPFFKVWRCILDEIAKGEIAPPTEDDITAILDRFGGNEFDDDDDQD